jgi:hypothetical protein
MSLSEDDSLAFTVEGFAYTTTLARLDNALIGEDFATFTVNVGESQTMGEEGACDQNLTQ